MSTTYSFNDFEIDDISLATGGRVTQDPLLTAPVPIAGQPRIPDTLSQRYGVDLAFNGDFLPSAAGDLSLTLGLDGLRGVLMRALITQPGELHWAPGYGIGVGEFLNAKASTQKLGELKNRIRSTLLREEDVDEIQQLDVQVGFPGANLPGEVTVSTRVRVAGLIQELALRIRRTS